MSDDLISKRRADQCTTHSHACDCREYAHAKYTADLLAEIERLRVVGADLQAARERAYDNRDMALQAVEEVERERDLWKSQVHDEMAANLAFRAAGGALQDEDMPTFCARIIAERDKLFIRGREWAELSGRMERERDALRARIEGAATGKIVAGRSNSFGGFHVEVATDIGWSTGQRVALVVVND